MLKRWPTVDIDQKRRKRSSMSCQNTAAQPAEFVKLKSKRPSAKQATD